MKLHKAYKITWIDAADLDDKTWSSHEDMVAFAKQKETVVSYGILVDISNDYYTLAGDIAEDKTYSRITKIPVGWIKKSKLLD